MQPGQGDGVGVSTVPVSRTFKQPCSFLQPGTTHLEAGLFVCDFSFFTQQRLGGHCCCFASVSPFVHKIITCTGFYDLGKGLVAPQPV